MHEKILSKKDVIKGWAKYFLCAEVSSGFERLTAPAFCSGMDPVLNKLYHDSPEEYKEVLSSGNYKVQFKYLSFLNDLSAGNEE